MNLFEQMSEELLGEELLSEIKIDALLAALADQKKIQRYVDSIKTNNVVNLGRREVRDMNNLPMNRLQVDAALIKNKVYQAAKAADINGNINLILNYYCPASH